MALIISILLHLVVLSIVSLQKYANSSPQSRYRSSINVQLTKTQSITSEYLTKNTSPVKIKSHDTQSTSQQPKSASTTLQLNNLSEEKHNSSDYKNINRQTTNIEENHLDQLESSTQKETTLNTLITSTSEVQPTDSQTSNSTDVASMPIPLNLSVADGIHYKLLETEFEVYQSSNPNEISINKALFSIDDNSGTNKSYTITRSMEPNSPKVSVSKGRISPSGLKPSYYEVNDQYVNFAWSDEIVSFNYKSEKLQKNTQDEMSYMYQFMFSPPSDKTTIVIASGTQLVTYDFYKLNDEMLQTKLGAIQTVHLQSDGEQKIDLWLASNYQFIPIRIRKTNKDGTFTEQTATKLTTTLNNAETVH